MNCNKYLFNNFKLNLLASWEYWSDWGSCDGKCGTSGIERRTRQCLNGNVSDNGCQGMRYEEQQCTAPPCCKNTTHSWTVTISRTVRLFLGFYFILTDCYIPGLLRFFRKYFFG